MPIFEYYCKKCNTIFSFLSRSISTRKNPLCPKCKRKMTKQVSQFSMTHNNSESEFDEDSDFPVDDAKLEQAMEYMAGDMEGIDENDPRQAARLMRTFASITGVSFNKGIEEAISRMEKGENPEKIEAEMGDVLDEDNPFSTVENKAKLKKLLQSLRNEPTRDPTLYEM